MTKSAHYKYLIALFILMGAFSNVKAQRVEIGVLAGGSYYYGDIVNEWEASTISGSVGVFLRYHLNENFAIKGFGGYCRVGGADSNSTSSSWQRNRNLSFWADVYEGSVQIEYSFVKDLTRGRRLLNRFVPYVFAGVGGFYFVNYGNYPLTNAAVKLSPLRTEGVLYSNFSTCIPVGVGARYKLTSKINIGAELGIRFTSTTFLDDVGGSKAVYWPLDNNPVSQAMSNRSNTAAFGAKGMQRGKMTISDMYFIYGITLSYRFGRSVGGGGGGYRGRAIRCPRFY